MKVFLKYFAIPLLIATIAAVLFIVDSLIGGLFVKGKSFTWVAFIIWTVFYTATLTDRVKALIGVCLGILAAVIMMLITSSFSFNVYTISISALIGVFVVNFLVMHLDKTAKIWCNSISGAFAGISLTFSGLGIGLNPLASVSEAFLMIGIILTYVVLGLACGFFSTFFTNKINKKLATFAPTEQSKS